MVTRRSIVLGIAAILLQPLAARAQQTGKIGQVGVLLYGTPAGDRALAVFRAGLSDLGYVEGKNIVLEYRYAEGKPERLPGLALELANLKPNVIFALGGDVAPFARTATTSIPIVMVVSDDPLGAGLVASLARPGGNLTGVTLVSSELAAKRLQFLKEIAPGISRAGILWNPGHVDPEYRETQVGARSLGIQLQPLEVRSHGDFEAAFRAAAAARVEAIVVVSSRLMTLNRQQITDFAARDRILLVTGWGPWAHGGALLSYGPDLDLIARRAASYVDKILKGAMPGDLPIERPTKFELVINVKTAKAFGLTVPPSLLLRADRVVE